jgi:hypothetical protein
MFPSFLSLHQTCGRTLVELQVIDEPIADETVRLRLKKDVKPWLKAQWCIPTVSSEYVAAMEDVLDVYALAAGPEPTAGVFR